MNGLKTILLVEDDPNDVELTLEAQEAGQARETILMLERGTWWTTPVSTVQDKEVATYDFLVRKQQPVQHWSSQNHFRGAVDLLTRCYRRPGNEDGLL